MATYRSLLKLNGTINDLTFYTWRGKPVVRTKSNLNRSRVMGSPEFGNSRKAMKEFGGASVVGKCIRQALQPWKDTCLEGQTVNRLNSVILKIIQEGAGEKGSRTFSLAGREHLLRGFDLKEKEKFGSRFKAPLGLHYNLLGDHLQITLGSLRPAENLGAPMGTAHYRFSALLVWISDHHLDPETGKYAPLHPKENGRSLLLETGWHPRDEQPVRHLLETPLSGEHSLKAGLSLIVFGILSFGSELENQIESLLDGNCMTVLDVKGL